MRGIVASPRIDNVVRNPAAEKRSYRACKKADDMCEFAVLRRLNRASRAALDTEMGWEEAVEMDERIDLLEREVSAIKSEIAVIKSTYGTVEDTRRFDCRLSRVEEDIADLKADVAELKADVAQLRVELEKIRGEMAQLEARLKSWMINLAISLITVMSGIQFALYAALRQ
ncbi:MAG: hypothetical protein V4631_22890 [Pseudomonadota bacterium]